MPKRTSKHLRSAIDCSGRLYFSNSIDQLAFESLLFERDSEQLSFTFLCNESKYGSYGGDFSARRLHKNKDNDKALELRPLIYETGPIRPYHDPSYLSMKVWIRLDLKLLYDDDKHPWIYVDATWTESNSEFKIHGLLEGHYVSKVSPTGSDW